MTSTPHDALFKSVFEHPEHAAAELRHLLPPEISAAIRWPSLTLAPGSFVDPELADHHTDLLFSAQVEATGELVLIYLLFEHLCCAPHKCSYAAPRVMRRRWRCSAQVESFWSG